MKRTLQLLQTAVVAIAASLTLPTAWAQPFGQWDFNGGNLNATVGANMQYLEATTAGATTFGSTTTLGLPAINGTNALVMCFPAATQPLGYAMPTPGANGGGSLVNDYTIIMDLLYPSSSAGRVRPLVQTDDGVITAAADLIVTSANGIGVGGGTSFGTIAPNTWYRVAFVVNGSAQQVRMYIDGIDVGSAAIPDPFDSRFALSPSATAQILNNNDTNVAPGYVNSIQLRSVALSSGQVQALGAASADGIPQVIPAVPSFIQSRSPAIGATGVGPKPNLNVVVDQGDTTINAGSFQLSMDGAVQAAMVTGPAANRYTVNYDVATILEPLSSHSVSLIYSDSVAGFKTNTWSFQIANYQSVTLPAPIVFENFDSTPEGSVPAGWTVTNATTPEVAGFDLTNPNSDTYKDFVTITHNRMETLAAWDGPRRIAIPPIVVNGVLLDRLGSGSLFYAESDNRGGNQVQAAISASYNMTGRSNIFAAWYSTYEQNQDSLGAVEYSVDGGTTWDPVIYMLNCCIDGQSAVADVVRFPNGSIDGYGTMNRAEGNQAYGLPYGAFICVASNRWASLSNYISPRINDDPIESKRVEVVRLPRADNSASVRFRFLQTGTASWYFGIDNFGLYSINTPVISTQPQAQTVDAGTPVTFTVVASGAGTLTYQWRRNGMNIPGATGASFTIASTTAGDAALYTVVVSNSDGPTTSSPAQLTVVTTPQILSNPLSQVADVGGSVALSITSRGGQPLSYQWYYNGGLQAGAISRSNVLNNLQLANSGSYLVIISNSFGKATSAVARVVVVSDAPGSGAINQNLVVHLRFDGDNLDTSGRGNHGTAVGAPGISPGLIGSGALDFTSAQNGSSFNYVSLGKPADLNFGDTNDFSVSFWAKAAAGTWRGDPAFIGNKNWNSGGNNGWIAANNGGGEFQWNYREAAPNDRKDYDSPSPNFGNNNWHHIAMAFVRGGLAYTYVDGVQVDVRSLRNGLLPPSSIDTSSLGTPLDTNVGQDGTGSYTDGGGVGITNALIDDVGIWRRALSPQEVVGIYLRGLTNSDFTTASAGLAVPPSIATPPTSQTISAGGSATFTVSAAGTAPLSYQWLKNGVNIAGATAATLTLNGVSAASEADYSVRVSNSAGQITSASARLAIFNGTLNQSLVALLKFDGDYHDATHRGNNGAAVGSPTFAVGRIGQSVKIRTLADGSSFNYVTLGYPPDLQFDTNNFSVSFWVNYTSATDDPPFLANKNWDSSSNTGWIFAHQGAPNYLRVVVTGTPRGSGNRSQFTLAGAGLGDGNWHHIVGSFWRGQNFRIYVDGVLANVTALPIVGSVDTVGQTWTRGVATGGFAVNIGQDGTGKYIDNGGGITGGAAGIEALIDQAAFFRRQLTPQDVSAIYNAGALGKEIFVEVTNISRSGSNVTVTWVDGIAPFTVEGTGSLSVPNWTTVTTTSAQSATFFAPTGGYFRVRGSSQ